MFSLEEIIRKILVETSVTEEKLNQMIEDKELELSGLVSKEGAAYIVGRELGVDLIKEAKRDLKIKNLVSGLGNTELVVSVVRLFEKREWEKDGKKGTVLSMVVGDETGTTRLTLWNDQIDLLQKLNVGEGDTIKISKAFVKDGLNGPEISLGKKGTVEKVEGSLDKIENEFEEDYLGKFEKSATEGLYRKEMRNYERKEIVDLKDNLYCEVKACLVNVFSKNPIFVRCKECGGAVEKQEDAFICQLHGAVEAEYNLVLSGIIDDGTETMRTVFFREVAEKVLGKTAKEVKDGKDVLEKFEGLGKDFILKGKVKKSDFSGELEMVVNQVDRVDIKKECEGLLKEI